MPVLHSSSPAAPSHFLFIPGQYLPPENLFLHCSNNALLEVFGSRHSTAPCGNGFPRVAFHLLPSHAAQCLSPSRKLSHVAQPIKIPQTPTPTLPTLATGQLTRYCENSSPDVETHICYFILNVTVLSPKLNWELIREPLQFQKAIQFSNFPPMPFKLQENLQKQVRFVFSFKELSWDYPGKNPGCESQWRGFKVELSCWWTMWSEGSHLTSRNALSKGATLFQGLHFELHFGQFAFWAGEFQGEGTKRLKLHLRRCVPGLTSACYAFCRNRRDQELKRTGQWVQTFVWVQDKSLNTLEQGNTRQFYEVHFCTVEFMSTTYIQKSEHYPAERNIFFRQDTLTLLTTK